jgi:hypothetical protein
MMWGKSCCILDDVNFAKCSNRGRMESNNNVGVAHEVMEGNEQNVHGI